MLVVSTDAIRIELYGSLYSPPDKPLSPRERRKSDAREKRLWKIAYKRIEEALAQDDFDGLVVVMGLPGSGKSTWIETTGYDLERKVVLDATNLTYSRRRKARIRARDAGKSVTLVWVHPPFGVSFHRNNARPEGRRVGLNQMCAMVDLILRDRPSLDEGWDKLLITEGSHWEVRTP